ncbi:MAG: hypothetical protein K2O15_11610 [Lachnospiraceae bacterium]|nr:hypothetical protein [Lachnospiraceae bacterium]
MKRLIQILCIAIGVIFVAFCTVDKQHIEVKTDKKARVEVEEVILGRGVKDLKSFHDPSPECDIQKNIDNEKSAEFKEGLSEWRAEDMENLQSALLWPKSQEDIDKIGKVTSLKRLDISLIQEGKETNWNLAAISRLENLEELNINGGNDELDTQPLRELKNVKVLTLEGTDFDISFLSGMEALEELYTNRTGGIENLSMVTGLKNLKILDLYFVHEADLRLLKELEQLEEIEIASGDLYGFEGLENLSEIKRLKLQGSCLSDKTPYMDMGILKNMKRLEELTIGGIEIGDVDALTKLESLEWIVFVNTGIDDIESLCKMPNLKTLAIYGNKSKMVEKQGEAYQEMIRDLQVSDDRPHDFDW